MECECRRLAPPEPGEIVRGRAGATGLAWQRLEQVGRLAMIRDHDAAVLFDLPFDGAEVGAQLADRRRGFVHV